MREQNPELVENRGVARAAPADAPSRGVDGDDAVAEDDDVVEGIRGEGQHVRRRVHLAPLAVQLPDPRVRAQGHRELRVRWRAREPVRGEGGSGGGVQKAARHRLGVARQRGDRLVGDVGRAAALRRHEHVHAERRAAAGRVPDQERHRGEVERLVVVVVVRLVVVVVVRLVVLLLIFIARLVVAVPGARARRGGARGGARRGRAAGVPPGERARERGRERARGGRDDARDGARRRGGDDGAAGGVGARGGDGRDGGRGGGGSARERGASPAARAGAERERDRRARHGPGRHHRARGGAPGVSVRDDLEQRVS